jgi:hypothetical protein
MKVSSVSIHCYTLLLVISGYTAPAVVFILQRAWKLCRQLDFMYIEHFTSTVMMSFLCTAETSLQISFLLCHSHPHLTIHLSIFLIILIVPFSAFHDSQLTEALSLPALPLLRVSSRAPSLPVLVLDPLVLSLCVLPSFSSHHPSSRIASSTSSSHRLF